MIKTYALEPAATSDATALVAFVQGLGIEHGRLMAEFPRSWIAMALSQGSLEPSIRERKRIEELIQRISTNGRIKVRTGLPYDGHQTWLTNAVKHIDSFDAVIHADDSPCPTVDERVNPASSLLSDPPYWQVDRRASFLASRGVLAALLKPLLVLDQKVAIMDPFFNLTHQRYLDGLHDIASVLNPSTAMVIHASVEGTAGRRPMSADEWANACRTAPLRYVDQLKSMLVVRWASADGVGRPHDRWVITPRGGIELGRGIATGRVRNTATLIPARAAAELWEQYGEPPYASDEFELRDSVQLR